MRRNLWHASYTTCTDGMVGRGGGGQRGDIRWGGQGKMGTPGRKNRNRLWETGRKEIEGIIE